jgi:RNA polymerase sigma-70 factor (ECF subfamily)
MNAQSRKNSKNLINFAKLNEIGKIFVDSRLEKDFNNLYKEYKKPLTIYCYKIIKDYNSSLECVNMVFSQIWEKIDSYTYGNAFSAWVFAIARNAALQYLKTIKYVVKGNSKKLPIKKYSIEELEESNIKLFDKYISKIIVFQNEDTEKEKLRKIAEITICLNNNEKMLLFEREILNIPDYKLAKKFNISPVTVRVKIHQIKEKIRNYCKKEKINLN